MSDFSVDFTFDPSGYAELLGPTGDVGKAVEAARDTVASRARSNAPVRTGRLRSSIDTTPLTQTGVGPEATVVARAPYARPVHAKYSPFLRDALQSLTAGDFDPLQ